ncbi:PAS domain S-box protein [Haliangium sp.]|uniref:PAS domain S-box protein n=1 Tax=Haliangium sp. TaxID=2663208 RepID=UPI003D1317CD
MGGDDEVRGQVLAAFARGGFSDVAAQSELSDPDGEGARGAPAAPDLVLVTGSIEVLAQAREAFAEVPIVAVIRTGSDGAYSGTDALRAGADEVLEHPCDGPVLATRVRRLITADQTQRKAQRLAGMQQAMVDILSLGATAGDSPEGLHHALVIAAEVLSFDRAALIAHAGGSEVAYVIAATDEPDLAHFALAFEEHALLREAMDGAAPVLVEDIDARPGGVPAGGLFDRETHGVAVFPVLWKGEVLGAVVLGRRERGVGHVDSYGRAFAIMLAEHLAVRLQHGQVLESLREQTHRVSRARYEAERRLRTLDALRDHFDASADGVLVLDADARILFVNRTAEQVTGFARDGLIDGDISLLVPTGGRERIREAVHEVLAGHNLKAFDIDLLTTSHERICVSMTTSTVLGESGAAILSFRDVTAQRAVEDELHKTKDFLERLIDSAVDAIVAADLRGNILIFNKGAERIFGYTADDVIGRIAVWDLYVTDVPKQVMRMLRSTQYGGVGRIDQIRREILNKSGERVPVNMTASIIYEDGREVATVGIFSDLRDRIRIEQRLLQAQEKLERTSRQAMLTELAGAAAHELNQPLTSIQACAQMIERRSDPDAPYMRHLHNILEQAERMATIVRKIGQITKYETKQYMPGTEIVDLDRSSAHVAVDPATPLEYESAAPDSEYRGDYSDEYTSEFDHEHQITIARVEYDETLPRPGEEGLLPAAPSSSAPSSPSSSSPSPAAGVPVDPDEPAP